MEFSVFRLSCLPVLICSHSNDLLSSYLKHCVLHTLVPLDLLRHDIDPNDFPMGFEGDAVIIILPK